MHQIDFHNKELDALFKICDTGEKIPSAKEPKSVNAKSDKGGRKSILDKFPDIPVIATDFIKASGFKAQEKRRDNNSNFMRGFNQRCKGTFIKSYPWIRRAWNIRYNSAILV